MAAQSYEPTPEELSLLDTVIRAVARARRLGCGDFQDFAQTVHLKLIERRYDAFSRFRGDSSLRTYLAAVRGRFAARPGSHWPRAPDLAGRSYHTRGDRNHASGHRARA